MKENESTGPSKWTTLSAQAGKENKLCFMYAILRQSHRVDRDNSFWFNDLNVTLSLPARKSLVRKNQNLGPGATNVKQSQQHEYKSTWQIS